MGEKRITLYRSSDEILLVGEGDFSFSLCLARAFGTAKNMVATSLDSRGTFSTIEIDKLYMYIIHATLLSCMLIHFYANFIFV